MSKILIIEDSQPLITLLMKRFILAGVDCEFIVQTGNLSREILVDEIILRDPDLIILDLKMPGTGGIAILEELRHREKETSLPAFPIIILTALEADPNEIESLKEHAQIVDFIRKPIQDVSAFIKHVIELLP